MKYQFVYLKLRTFKRSYRAYIYIYTKAIFEDARANKDTTSSMIISISIFIINNNSNMQKILIDFV